jgi:hypothetical protein
LAGNANAVLVSLGKISGPGVAVGVATGVASLLSAAEVATGVGEDDWDDWDDWDDCARASGEKQTRTAAAKTRRFIVMESLPTCRKIKAAIYIDKDAPRSAGVNCPSEIRKRPRLPAALLLAALDLQKRLLNRFC